MAQLSNFKFEDLDEHTFIEHPHTGIFTPAGMWLREFGIEQVAFVWNLIDDDDTIATFDVTLSDGEDEDECIQSDEEDDLVIGQNVIRQLVFDDARRNGMGAFMDDYNYMGAQLDEIEEAYGLEESD